MRKPKSIPDRETLSRLLNTGKTIEWIAEKWNVTPQTVKGWFSKLNLYLPGKRSITTPYQRVVPNKPLICPVCQSVRSVNFILDIKHWYCVMCDVEYDKHHTIYVYDEDGILVEVIGRKPNFWNSACFGRGTSKTLIKTITT